MATNTKPLTTEAIALTEKKMDMTLDDIIKMSKPVKKPKARVTNKNRKPFNITAQDRAVKAKQFLASRTSLRQGALAKRRSSLQENQFPVATAAARRAATATFRPNGFAVNRGANWNNPRAPAHFNRGANVGFNVKRRPQHLQYQQKSHANDTPRQRPQTLDSLFAKMKEQRLNAPQNSASDARTYQQRPPFQHRRPFQRGQQQHGRGRFAN
uniref:Uncharacterized protein n=1 Tax=Kalanchoe fedtschenkoi TaxID=63787 RepID=A0A7N0R9J5_KALFE